MDNVVNRGLTVLELTKGDEGEKPVTILPL